MKTRSIVVTGSLIGKTLEELSIKEMVTIIKMAKSIKDKRSLSALAYTFYSLAVMEELAYRTRYKPKGFSKEEALNKMY